VKTYKTTEPNYGMDETRKQRGREANAATLWNDRQRTSFRQIGRKEEQKKESD